MSENKRNILIIGGGPAGSTTAFWLAKAGFNITVAERSTSKFAYGQGIDITGPAAEICRKMGLEDRIRSTTTGEAGFAILDDQGEEIAALGTAGHTGESGGRQSFTLTQEIEIMRGDLTRIFADAASGLGVIYRYGCTVTEIRQSEKSVTATLSDRGRPEEFSILIGADGLRSKTRGMIFADYTDDCYKPIDQFLAFFSMPGEDGDRPNARLQHAPGGRSILIRPAGKEGVRSSCYAGLTMQSPKLEGVLGKAVDLQKAAMAEVLDDFGGIGPRALREMQAAKDFYFERIAQIKLPRWYRGRCALVGDAAYAPSPLTGQGTTLAILGAYVLAGELNANSESPEAAFAKYDAVIRGYVEKAQRIPLRGMAPKLANPSTGWGIGLLRFIFWLVAWSGIWKYISIGAEKKFVLPPYDL